MHMPVQYTTKSNRTLCGLFVIFSLLLLPVSLAKAQSHGELAAAAEAAIRTSDYRMAAGHYRKAYELVAGKDEKRAFQYRLGEADALSQQAFKDSDLKVLKQSIELTRNRSIWPPAPRIAKAG